MTAIAIHLIDENGHNIRRTPATAEQDAQLESIRTLGVLQPVLLRPGDSVGRYFVVAGHRRVRCARKAGLDDIPAEVLTHEDKGRFAASQAAENIVRVPMDPVDQWRAIVALQDAGYTLEGAGQTLGLSERAVKRLDKLGHIIPEILDLMIGRGLPDIDDLAAIAGAPIERQREVFPMNAAQHVDDPDKLIARRCMTTRISRNLAIFDVEASGIVFEEDLFAEPGGDDQFTTGDVAGFLKAQKAALVASVNARKKKGERVTLASFKSYDMVIPKGFTRTYGDIKKRYPASGKLMLFTCVREDTRLGEVAMCNATEDAKPAAKAAAKQIATPADVAEEYDEVSDEDARNAIIGGSEAADPEHEQSGPTLTKRGQTMLAAMKTDALRDRLDEISDDDQASVNLGFLCSALILSLSGHNVTVNGSADRWGRVSFADLQAQIVSPSGAFTSLEEGEIARLAAMALSRILRVSDPGTAYGSGVVAEWIGAAIGAEVRLPRFDTAEFLACMGKEALQAVAEQNGRGGLKTAKGLREALTGSLPDWRGASFGAPGPRPPAPATDYSNDQQEDAA